MTFKATYPAPIEAAIRRGFVTPGTPAIECSVRDFKVVIDPKLHDRPDVRTVLSIPPVGNSWRVKIDHRGVYLMSERELDLAQVKMFETVKGE